MAERQEEYKNIVKEIKRRFQYISQGLKENNSTSQTLFLHSQKNQCDNPNNLREYNRNNNQYP